MNTAIAQLAPMFAGLGIVSVLMIRFSMEYGFLESRRTERNCPSCGRRIEGHVCRHCTG
jgi:hypothetical protein